MSVVSARSLAQVWLKNENDIRFWGRPCQMRTFSFSDQIILKYAFFFFFPFALQLHIILFIFLFFWILFSRCKSALPLTHESTSVNSEKNGDCFNFPKLWKIILARSDFPPLYYVFTVKRWFLDGKSTLNSMRCIHS